MTIGIYCNSMRFLLKGRSLCEREALGRFCTAEGWVRWGMVLLGEGWAQHASTLLTRKTRVSAAMASMLQLAALVVPHTRHEL